MDTTSNSDLLYENARKYASIFVDGLNQSVTPFHAVEYLSKQLLSNGFQELKEKESWTIKKGQKYFQTRNNSTIVAYTVGKKINNNTACFKVVGAHSDSPNLRLAPFSYHESFNYERFNIHTYGGGMWQTWFDRDLAMGGKIVFKGKDDKLDTALVRFDGAVFKIPMLAIHLNRELGSKIEWNNETHLKAVMGTTVLNNLKDDKTELTEIDKKIGKKLANAVSKKINVPKENIVDYDICLYDSNKACVSGLDGEFISSGRLDNLGSSIPSIHALINSSKNIENSSSIDCVAIFDNEEIGSKSYQGCDSSFFSNSIKRLFSSIEDFGETTKDSYELCCGRSFVVSSDMAHCVNPNYSGKSQCNHLIKMHEGVAIKINPNIRYATDSEGTALIKGLAKKCGVPLQEYIINQDSPCGSTIGPIITSNTGIKTIDIGAPMWAMHSIRETCGVIDIYHYLKLFEEFYNSYESCVGNLVSK